jgi:hypothetical protein
MTAALEGLGTISPSRVRRIPPAKQSGGWWPPKVAIGPNTAEDGLACAVDGLNVPKKTARLTGLEDNKLIITFYQIRSYIMTHSISGNIRPSTRTSILLAADDTWNGATYEQAGRNTFLYRAHDGKFFKLMRSRWPEDPQGFKSLTLAEAAHLYDDLPEHYLTKAEAFPRKMALLS